MMHWVFGTVHKAAKPNFIINSPKLPKFLKSSSVQVSQALFLASERVLLKNLWWLCEKNQTLLLAISQNTIS